MLHLLIPLALAVQVPGASVVGTVTDVATGAPIGGVFVSLSDVDRTTVTDGSGRYVFADVPAGPQHLTLRMVGYREHTLHVLVPASGQLSVDVALEAQPVAVRPLEIRAAPAIRGLEGDERRDFSDLALTMAAVRNHPQLSEFDPFQAIVGGNVVVRPEAPSGLHLRGGAADQTAYVLNGVPVFSPYHAAGLFSAWNADALSSLEVSSFAPDPELPEVLSGVVVGRTRAAGPATTATGAASSTQGRITVVGGIGSGGDWEYLAAARTGFPGVFAPPDEPSYLRGGAHDLVGTVSGSVGGGHLELLGYSNASELRSSSIAHPAEAEVTPRNGFEWHSESFGVSWRRALGGAGGAEADPGRAPPTELLLRGWSARGATSSLWRFSGDTHTDLASARRDYGLLALVRQEAGESTRSLGLRLERAKTRYRVGSAGDSPAIALLGSTPRAAVIAAWTGPVTQRLALEVGGTVTLGQGSPKLSPRARVSLALTPSFDIRLSANRLHQFMHSLRNPESVVGTVFPAEHFVGSGLADIPVARGQEAALSAELRPVAGVRLGGQIFSRSMKRLVLVAPRNGEPFATEGFAVGEASAWGGAVELSVSAARWGALASWGLQDVSYEQADSSYVPEHGVTHLFEVGGIFFPDATSSVRLGMTGAAGRRATAIVGGLEWESCSLLDEGCEFGGSPSTEGQALGGTELPAYVRIDLTARKHWHVGLAGREWSIGVHGTFTNLLGRGNVLTYGIDPDTTERTAIRLRPRAPLVFGFDWRF